MEDRYIKPGNQERGWNDPPQFSYSLQMSRGPQRNLLNKRAAPEAASGARALPMTLPPSSLAPPPSNVATPPPGPVPPAVSVATPPSLLGPMRSEREADSSQSQNEPAVEDVVLVLNQALMACRQTIKDQVCNDVAKRLRILEDSWRAGRLSLSVRRRMDTLSLEFRCGRWDSADEIHRSLMVDHVTEVSQWMVGVKRLIAETRKLSPELLESLQNHAEPVQVSAEPVLQVSAEPVLQGSVEPVLQGSAASVQDSTEPVLQGSVEPVLQGSAASVQDSTEPGLQGSAASVQDSTEPGIQGSAASVQDSAEPVLQDTAGPLHQEPTSPVPQDPAEPVPRS